MQQIEIFTIPSPCVGVCEVNNKGYCRGCLRSREERLYWLRFTDQQKREVIRLCQARKDRVHKARLDYQAEKETLTTATQAAEQAELF